MATVRKWTGRESRALREAVRLSQREFAGKLGVTPRAVSKWESGGAKYVPRPDSQGILDTTLRMASDEERARFELILGAGQGESGQESASVIGMRLKAARIERAWTARKMAEMLRAAADNPDEIPHTEPGLVRMLRGWEKGDHRPSGTYRLLYCKVLGVSEAELFSSDEGPAGEMPSDGEATEVASEYSAIIDPQRTITIERPAEVNSQFSFSFDPAGMADRISELANWAETTNIGDGTLEYLDSAALQLAHDCLTVPPSQTGERADALINRIHDILRSGHQRLGQTRELYIIAGKLCAILSWISSDLGQLSVADAHARNGWTLADQADHDGLRALLLSAQSKIDFWRRRYDDAAKHARRGYKYDPPGTLRALLACQEADAFQAMGRIQDAMEALTRSESTQDAIRTQDDAAEEVVGGIFGCGIARQSNYSIATYLRSGSIDQALLHVDRAETAWRNGEEWAYGTWAQVQIGAAIAHLMNGEIDGAAMILRRILDQPAEKRLATLTTRLNREVTPLLAGPSIGPSKLAIALREGIADYGQSSIRQLPAGEEL